MLRTVHDRITPRMRVSHTFSCFKLSSIYAYTTLMHYTPRLPHAVRIPRAHTRSLIRAKCDHSCRELAQQLNLTIIDIAERKRNVAEAVIQLNHTENTLKRA